jgi:DNA-binding HxlR family transcriptional regulator
MYRNEHNQHLSYDAFQRNCVSHTILETISSKWVYLVVSVLTRGATRNGELQRRIEDISPKMLSQTLRSLERDGIVMRRVFPVVPPHVEYELTPLGANLAGLLVQIREWSEQNVPQILDARAVADAKRRRG